MAFPIIRYYRCVHRLSLEGCQLVTFQRFRAIAVQ